MISNLNQNSGSYTSQTNLEVSFKTHLPTKSPNIGFFKHSNLKVQTERIFQTLQKLEHHHLSHDVIKPEQCQEFQTHPCQ